jgi:ribosomal protein S18 acetylase RimI-like enzyme
MLWSYGFDAINFESVRSPPYNPPVHQVTIRAYSDTTDRPQVVVLWESVLGYDAPHNKPALAIDKKLEVEDGLFFVAVEDGNIVGTIMAGYDGHRGWIYSLAVSPKRQRQGIGAGLMEVAEKALTEKGAVKINLQIVDGNESVAAFYKSVGFVVEKRVSMGKRIMKNVPDKTGLAAEG